MRREDIAQVTDIDREAFPSILPPPNYQRELQNKLAHYIVAFDGKMTVEEPEAKPSPANNLSGPMSRVIRLFNRNHSSGNEPSMPVRQYIKGFAGLWILSDEAHITNFAVREIHRRQGIGELLLISTIDMATKLKARIITLEVRASNTAAQNLYHKYGFIKAGLRRKYYTDNNEDGIIMTTDDIRSASFQARFHQLKQALQATGAHPVQPDNR